MAEEQQTTDQQQTADQQQSTNQGSTTEPTPTAVETASEAAYSDVPDNPAGYHFDYAYGVEIDQDLDREARSAFHAAGIPKGLARHIVSEWNKRAASGPLSEDDQEAGHRHMVAQLQRQHGANYEAKVAAARSVIERLPAGQREFVVDLLGVSGLAHDPYVFNRLVTLGEIQAKRGGK